jgi:hypothetical protein
MLEIKLVVMVSVFSVLLSGLGTAITESFLRYEQRIAQESFDQAIAQAQETMSQVQNVDSTEK